MNGTDSVIATVRRILIEDVFVEATADQMDPDDGLRDVFGLDSLGFVELRVQCQERFGVNISNDDFTPDNFASIRSVCALVERLLAGSAAAGAPAGGARAAVSDLA